MAIIKCKMCGGDIMIAADKTFGTCEYCGSTMTLPKVDDDQRAAAFNRGNHFRRIGEFDKALAVYERIVAEDNTDAEAHWCCALCRFGIEYVEDPATYEYLPTCHRASFDSILEDVDYLAAVEYSDGITRRQYQKDAAKIAEVQRGILATSSQEEPFDVFICYKESDAEGNRTRDSLLAQEVYYQLTEQGYRVFFSRITLEDKVGAQYEPYIFAALNSAKVMVVIGTKEEHFNAVWVKNEWSRFLALMKKDRSKLLLPCYRDMDPYDMPEALSVLQSYDMGKIGFIQDLVRGIGKVLRTEPVQPVKETVVVQSQQAASTNTAPLLKRAFMFLEDGEWDRADDFCEQVLNIDPECAEAYLGKLMVDLRVKTRDGLKGCSEPFDGNNNYQKALRFADEKLKTALTGYIEHIKTRNENARLDGIYTRAKNAMSAANTESAYKEAAHLFESIREYKDSATLESECYEKAKKIVDDEKKCIELFKAYQSALQNEKSSKNVKGLAEENIRILTQRHEQLLGIRNNWNTIETGIVSRNNKIQTIQTEISKFENEKSSLGFFAGKRKKEIIAEIENCEEKIRALRKEINQEEAKKDGFSSLETLDNEISQTEEKIHKQNDTIAKCSAATNSQQIREELSGYAYGKTFLKSFSTYFNKIIKVGGSITFGSYPQHKNGEKNNIEWLVLDVKDGKALVISKYALDSKPYNTSYTNVTWETCTLRKWLKNDFINTAFSAEEKALIPTVTVSADKNPEYSTNPGNATQDQVFLLSITEANKYFISDRARQCEPTDYADVNGAYVNSDNGNCCWWLRSPGLDQDCAAFVYDDGDVNEDGDCVGDDSYAVRPALWIDFGA